MRMAKSLKAMRREAYVALTPCGARLEWAQTTHMHPMARFHMTGNYLHACGFTDDAHGWFHGHAIKRFQAGGEPRCNQLLVIRER